MHFLIAYNPVVCTRAIYICLLCRLHDLRIVPYGEDASSFIPHIANRSRKAKVPVLLINSTCLNTGHRFIFASDVAPGGNHINIGVDTSSRNINEDRSDPSASYSLSHEDLCYYAYNEPGGWCGEIIPPELTSVVQLPPMKYSRLSEVAQNQMRLASAVASSGK